MLNKIGIIFTKIIVIEKRSDPCSDFAVSRNAFYQAFYSVFDDEFAVMDILLNGKESFSRQVQLKPPYMINSVLRGLFSFSFISVCFSNFLLEDGMYLFGLFLFSLVKQEALTEHRLHNLFTIN